MVLNYKLTSTGQPVVFLHGMAASLRSWDPFIQELDSEKYQSLAIDLLGFGHSPMPRNVVYDYKIHIDSVLETITAAGITSPVILVGHSMGALIALRLAAENPSLVNKVITYGLPFFPNPKIAKREITSSKLRLQLILYGPTSHFLCTTWCRLLRPISKHLAHLYMKGMPKSVAEDSVLHTWQSYLESRTNIIENQNVPADLKGIKVSVILVYGAKDTYSKYIEPEKLLAGLNNTELKIVDGHSHNLPSENPKMITSLI